MNPETWFRDFGVAFKELRESDQRYMPEDIEKKFRNSPLFLHHDGASPWKEEDFPHCFNSTGFPIGPYDTFRANMKAVDGSGNFEMEIDACINSEGERFWMAHFFIRSMKDLRHNLQVPLRKILFTAVTFNSLGGKFLNTAFDMESHAFIDLNKPGWNDVFTKTIVFKGQKCDFKGYPVDIDGTVNMPCFHIREKVSKLCIDTMNPHFHMLSVRPKSDGKYGAWVEQRTHYVLVHKNNIPRIRSDSDAGHAQTSNTNPHNIMAHSRRAHFRLLSSPRFKNKRDQKILVRSMWVGPKEWEGESRQIYKFIERPNVTINPTVIF